MSTEVMTTPKTKKMKPIYVNQREIELTKKRIELGENLLNTFSKNVAETIGEISKEKMPDFPKNAVEIIKAELKSRYQFLQATDDFNLQSLGINPEPLYNEFQKNYQSWNKYDFEFIGNEFKAKADQPEINKWFVYADTEEKQKVIEMAETIISQFKAFKDAGLVLNPVSFKDAFNPCLLAIIDNDLSLNFKALPELFQHIDNGRFNLTTNKIKD